MFTFTSQYFHRFTLVDIGNTGHQSDGGVFSNSVFGQALDDGTLSFPKPSPLPGTSSPDFPYVIVGDEAFPLKNYLLHPYPGRYLLGMLINYNFYQKHNNYNFFFKRTKLYLIID